MSAFLMELPRHEVRGGAAVSLLVHAVLIAAAVVATIQTRAEPGPIHLVVPLFFHDAPDRPAVAPAPGLGPLAVAPPPQALIVPGTIPTVIPPPSTVPFDPARFAVEPVSPPVIARTPVDSGSRTGIYSDRWVEERPELLAHPAVRFPELLRQAGICGRAVIEAVIDTTGRAERGSIRVLSSTNPLFTQPAEDVVAGSIYRPGKISGRAVRVRVQVPVDFQVAAPGATMTHAP